MESRRTASGRASTPWPWWDQGTAQEDLPGVAWDQIHADRLYGGLDVLRARQE